MIKAENLSKNFGPFTAVDNISFSVEKGEVLGFLGPNGAGKSTTMKMLTGFLPATQGKAYICDYDVAQKPIEAKKLIGYLPEGSPAYGDMTPLSFLNFIAEVRGFSGTEKQQRVQQAIKDTHLESVVHKSIETLSKGFKRRVGIAQAILHDPQVLIMDEPTDGLDPNQKHEVRQLIRNMARDKAIIVSTHILEEVDAICSRAIIIAQGKVLFDGTPEQLAKKSVYHNAVNIVFKDAMPETFASKAAALVQVAKIEERQRADGKTVSVLLAQNNVSIIDAVSQLIQDEHWQVDELHVDAGHLDEVFRTITTSQSA